MAMIRIAELTEAVEVNLVDGEEPVGYRVEYGRVVSMA
jgi:hypothetical protein